MNSRDQMEDDQVIFLQQEKKIINQILHTKDIKNREHTVYPTSTRLGQKKNDPPGQQPVQKKKSKCHQYEPTQVHWNEPVQSCKTNQQRRRRFYQGPQAVVGVHKEKRKRPYFMEDEGPPTQQPKFV